MIEIWIDADSLPKNLRAIVLKAAQRTGCKTVFCADRSLPDVVDFIANDTARLRKELPPQILNEPDYKTIKKNVKSGISMSVVQSGENSADDYIVENAVSNSLCITHDIPLASRLLEKGCTVIDDRGRNYTKDNIRMLLSERAVNNELRSWGVFSEQQKRLTSSDTKAFADNFDRQLRILLEEK